jgi:hypothetical protein
LTQQRPDVFAFIVTVTGIVVIVVVGGVFIEQTCSKVRFDSLEICSDQSGGRDGHYAIDVEWKPFGNYIS